MHVIACFFLRADGGLKGVAVKMEGMAAGVLVVDDNFNHVVVFQDVRVGVNAVDGGVVGVMAGGEGGEDGWDLGGEIGDFVEEGAAGRKSVAAFAVGM